jgi:hypothetical protein
MFLGYKIFQFYAYCVYSVPYGTYNAASHDKHFTPALVRSKLCAQCALWLFFFFVILDICFPGLLRYFLSDFEI